jgi:hypothetical protein
MLDPGIHTSNTTQLLASEEIFWEFNTLVGQIFDGV